MDVSDDGHHRPWSPREMAPPQRRSRGTHLRRRFPSSARRSAAAACWLAAPIVRWRPAQECKIVSTCGRHFLVTDHRPPIPWETHRHVTRHWLCHFIMIFTSTLNIIVTCHLLNNFIGFWCRTNQVVSLGHVAGVFVFWISGAEDEVRRRAESNGIKESNKSSWFFSVCMCQLTIRAADLALTPAAAAVAADGAGPRRPMTPMTPSINHCFSISLSHKLCDAHISQTACTGRHDRSSAAKRRGPE